MGDVNERPHATAQGGLLRDVLVNVLGGKKGKLRTSRSDNIVIPEKPIPKNSDKVREKWGKGGKSTRQINASTITPIPSQSAEFSVQNALPDSLTRRARC